MQNRKGKIVVTGGAGFIGSHIADLMHKEGYEVHLIDNMSEGRESNVAHLLSAGAVLHKTDILDAKSLATIFTGAEFIFHTAAIPRVQFSIAHPREANAANVTGTLELLIAAHEAGVKRFVYSASSSAYGDQPTLPLVETMLPNPKSPYGMQKYYGEVQCKVWSEVYQLETVSLRYFNVYGQRMQAEGGYPLVIPKFLDMKVRGVPLSITGDGTQTRDFTHVFDVARANLLAATSPKVGKGEVFNIGAGNNKSVNYIAELIGGPTEYIPARFEPKNTLADNSKAKELLGWTPTITLEEGIAELKKLAGL